MSDVLYKETHFQRLPPKPVRRWPRGKGCGLRCLFTLSIWVIIGTGVWYVFSFL